MLEQTLRAGLRRLSIVACTAACAALVACGKGEAPPSTAAQPPAVSAAATPAKPAPVANDEAARDKARNTYTRVYNLMVDDNRSWAAIYKSYRELNVQGKSHSENSFYGSPDTLARQLNDLKGARVAGAGDAQLDGAVDGVIAAGEKLLATWEPMVSYYRSKGFLEDGWAKARAADADMNAGFSGLLARIDAMDVELDRIQEARRQHQMDEYKKAGDMLGYSTLDTMASAKKFMGALDKVAGSLKNKEAVAAVDARASDLQTALEGLSKAVSDAKAKAAEGKGPSSGYMSLHNSLQESVGQWRVFKQSRHESTWRNIVSYYNNAVGTYNKGFGR
jgi:hypothetical protein